MTDLLGIVVLVCLAYLLLTTFVYVALVVVGALESTVRRQESGSEDYATLASSRFTIPVSVIAAAYNEEPVIVSTVETLLAFDYPEHEVIVVNDGSADGTLEKLREAYQLEPYELFVRRVFESAEVRAIYRSAIHPNLIVVDKENGGKADAWNAGLNVARYRYVCGVDADTLFDRKALLKGMRLVVQDPGPRHRRDQPPERRHASRNVRSPRRPDGVASTSSRSSPFNTSTSCARSSTTGSPGHGCGSCSARPARSRSGDGTCSRRSAATRGRSPARTSR